ncbi:hypothetical protein NXS19_012987 [Fusarium pseudograminearum]|nr:hypothetical protein NXS19_012987 [Fusarium pseudograminearum]
MPFFVDITGVLRTFFFMGVLIPWNINPMSHYSLSVKLLEEGAFTHPAYQMEDIIALIRYTIMTKREIRIRPLNLISINGPTSGSNYVDEIREWALQIRRWTIGAGEVFHYFIVKTYPTVLVRWNLPVPGDGDSNYNKGLQGVTRGLLHWILMLPTILAYSFVELYSFFELAFRGKDVCKHNAANKSNLVLVTDTSGSS